MGKYIGTADRNEIAGTSTDHLSALKPVEFSSVHFSPAAIVEASPDGIAVVALDGVIHFWNAGAETITGFAAAEVLGREVTMLLPGDRHDEFEKIVDALRRGRAIRDYETAARHKDGRRIEISVTAAFLRDDSGKPTAVCGIVRDIGVRKEIQHDLALRAEAERRFLGRQLHDSLGQQLTGIGMFAAALKNRVSSDETSAQITGRLTAAVDKAKDQLRTLLKGLLPVAIEGQGLRAALEELAAEVEANHRIRCIVEAEGELALDNNFVATQLYSIAREAVHNAVKHSGADEIRIGWRAVGGIRLSIRDNGKGLPAAVGSESGRGLRILHHRCGFIHGRLEVESEPGRGTMIVCTVPTG